MTFENILYEFYNALIITETSEEPCDSFPREVKESGMEIPSPHYPSNYAPNITCSTMVLFPKGHIVKLAFLQFDIYGSKDW